MQTHTHTHTQTWTLTTTSMRARRHGGEAIGLSCYWRHLFSWATNKELPFSPRIAHSAPCLMKWRTTMSFTWAVTQCELGEFVFDGKRRCIFMCVWHVCAGVYVCMRMGVVSMHNHESVKMFNRKLKISWRAGAIFTHQNCWLGIFTHAHTSMHVCLCERGVCVRVCMCVCSFQCKMCNMRIWTEGALRVSVVIDSIGEYQSKPSSRKRYMPQLNSASSYYDHTLAHIFKYS